MTASASSIRVVPATDQAVTGVGKYRYIAMLAEGGMADVYLAITQSAGFEKLVVIKQLRDSLAEDPTFVTMFMDEARLAARLNHPNVVQTLEVGTDARTGLHFIAMEFLEGVAHVRLARLKERVPPPLAFHVRILVDVLRGLHYAHELRDFDGKPLNVVHRDVSPQNVMLTFSGVVKILDFGIAKAALAAEQRPGDFKGKLEYMAPEQAATVPDVDRRADIFSVGVMLWEAVTRRRLYDRGTNKLQRLLSGQLPDVLEVAPSTPKRLAAICAKAMAHDRHARYATADAMADDLEEWLESTTQHVSARDVGSYVAEKFSSTRAKISAAIEAQLALFRSLPPDTAPDTIPISRLPVADVALDGPEPETRVMMTPRASSISADDAEDPSEVETRLMLTPRANSTSADVVANASESATVVMMTPRASSTSANGWTSSEGAPVITLARPGASDPRSTSKSTSLAIATVAVVGVVLLSGIVAVVAKKPQAASAPKATATALAPTPAAAAVSAPAPKETAAPKIPETPQIDLTIKATPSEARIFIDDEPLRSNPAVGTYARDGAMHVIRIEAPGYTSREESIAFDRSALVSIELQPVPPAPTPTESATSTSRPATRWIRPPQPRVPSQRPSGKLDSENPYE